MPAIARGDGTDSVASDTGSGYQCKSPSTTATSACSGDVYANGIGVVRIGDPVAVHTMSGCSPEHPGLSTSSPNVYVNGKGCGRLGDNYAGDGANTITSGSSNVFVNG